MAARRAILHRRDFLTVGAAGLGLNLVDYLAIRQAQAAKNDYRLSTIVSEIIESAPFQMRTRLNPAPPSAAAGAATTVGAVYNRTRE